MEIVLSIVGFILTIAISVIGYLIVSKFNGWDAKLNILDEKLDFQITKQNEYDYRIKKVENRLDSHSHHIEDLKSRVTVIETKHKVQHND